MKQSKKEKKTQGSKSLYLSAGCIESIKLFSVEVSYRSGCEVSKNKFIEFLLENYGKIAVDKYVKESTMKKQ